MTQFTILIQYGEQLIEENSAFPKYSKVYYNCSLDSVVSVLGLLSQLKTDGVIHDFILYTQPSEKV